LLEMGGTHGDEQNQVAYIRDRMSPGGLPAGVLPIIANREAADTGQRYIGRRQLMAWYPGSFEGETHEERTAAGITWLIDRLNPNHLVIDRHDNSCSDRYAYFGYRTTPAAIAAAHIMTHTVAVVSGWSRFCTSAPRSLAVEEAVPPDAAAHYHKEADLQIERLAQLGESGLTALYHDMRLGEEMQFFEILLEVNLVDLLTGAPNPKVLNILPELEALDLTEGWGAEINLSDQAKDALGIARNVQCFRDAGGYSNRSLVVANATLGVSDDTPRKAIWGAVMRKQLAPRPLPGTDLLTFEDLA